MEVHAALSSQLSTIFSQPRAPIFLLQKSAFGSEYHCQEQHSLLSVLKFFFQPGFTETAIASLLASWLPPLLALLISDGGTNRITESTLTNILFNQELCYFYCRNELLAKNRIALANSIHMQGCIICLSALQAPKHLASWLLPLLALLLISDGGTRSLSPLPRNSKQTNKQ